MAELPEDNIGVDWKNCPLYSLSIFNFFSLFFRRGKCDSCSKSMSEEEQDGTKKDAQSVSD